MATQVNAASQIKGTLPDANLTGNVTVAGNTFNGAGQLAQMDGGGKLPDANLSANVVLVADIPGTISNITIQGNTFNGASQLVKLDGSANFSIAGTVTASNVSGSTSGTNTGDQDLSTYATKSQVLVPSKATGTGGATLSADPGSDDRILVFVNGLLGVVSTDYTRSGVTVTLTDGAAACLVMYWLPIS